MSTFGKRFTDFTLHHFQRISGTRTTLAPCSRRSPSSRRTSSTYTNTVDRKHVESLRRSSPLGRVLAAALDNRDRARDVVKEAVEDTGRHVVHELERFLNTLGTIAGITPLLGLLGTVIGMIKVFSAITESGVGDPAPLAGGISEALITTAAGLTVAIPTYFFYRYFRGKVRAYVVGMEEQALDLINTIEHGNRELRRSELGWG